MDRHYIGRVTATALGFLMGALLAIVIAPGDTLLIVGTGVVFGFFARALFNQGFLGYSLWVCGKPAGRKAPAAKPGTGHR